MFCTKCGKSLPDGASYCDGCGAPTAQPEAPRAPLPPLGRRLTPGPDGKYRWTYEMSLFKNPTFFALVWEIFFFIVLGILAFMILLDVIEGNGNAWSILKVFGWILLGMTVLVGLGYLLYAALMGGKYVVEFELDDKGVLHRQTETQARRARKLGTTAALLGAASGSYGAVGAGLAAQNTEMYTEFAKVKGLKASPRRNVIKLRQTLVRNQVYPPREDFEFVLRYITERCTNLNR